MSLEGTTHETPRSPQKHSQVQVLHWAREVLHIESETLAHVGEHLDRSFVDTVALIHECSRSGRGRVIISGVGKSGIVARKWVATFSSTGTASYFVNPTEAAHGDLGVIGNDDLIILISLSGETDELIPILKFSSERNLSVIAVTGNAQSSLARAATVSLAVPIPKEACPLGLAPTASSTAMVAVGDALAVVLMRLKGFTRDDFARVHPGGNLGKNVLSRVFDVMKKGFDLPVVLEETAMDKVVVEMTQKKVGAAVVLDAQKRLSGLITDGDLRRFLLRQRPLHESQAREVMTANPVTIQKNCFLYEARQVLESRKITQLVVTEADRSVVGILHIHDIPLP